MRGFTLIELIITVAVVALLGVLAVPSLTRVQERQTAQAAVALMSGCFMQGQALARAVDSTTVKWIQITFDGSGLECRIQRLDPLGNLTEEEKKEIVDLRLDPDEAILAFSPGGGDTAAVTVATTPPYSLEYQGYSNDNLEIELTVDGQPQSLIINTSLGTVL